MKKCFKCGIGKDNDNPNWRFWRYDHHGQVFCPECLPIEEPKEPNILEILAEFANIAANGPANGIEHNKWAEKLLDETVYKLEKWRTQQNNLETHEQNEQHAKNIEARKLALETMKRAEQKRHQFAEIEGQRGINYE